MSGGELMDAYTQDDGALHISASVSVVGLTANAALWNGDGVVGNTGDGTTWGDADNWTVAAVNDVAPADIPPGDNVTFQTAPTVGVVDLGADRRVSSLMFEDGYDLENHTLAITTGELTVDTGVTATIGATILSSTVTKQGDGTLVITGSAPATELQAGTLEVASTGSIGSLVIHGGRSVMSGNVNGDMVNLGVTLAPGGTADAAGDGLLTAANVDALFANIHGTVPEAHARLDLVRITGNAARETEREATALKTPLPIPEASAGVQHGHSRTYRHDFTHDSIWAMDDDSSWTERWAPQDKRKLLWTLAAS